MVVEGLLAARQSSLESAVREQKMKDAPAETRDLRKHAWSESAVVPMVAELNETLRCRAMTLADPHPITGTYDGDVEGETPSRWEVTSEKDSKVKFQVDLKAFAEGKYEKACSCGMTSSSWVCACA